MQSVNFLAHQLKRNYVANQKHRYGMKHMHYIQLCIIVVFPGNTSDWQEAISLFISNASNLMVSVKDLLKASKAAHSLPHNYTPPPTMQATPLPYGYLQSPTPHHYPLSATGSTCAPQLNYFPPGTIQVAPLNYNQPATYQPPHPHPPVIPQPFLPDSPRPFPPATHQPTSPQPFTLASPQPASPQPFPPPTKAESVPHTYGTPPITMQPTTKPHPQTTPQTCFKKCTIKTLHLLKWEDEQGIEQTFCLSNKVKSRWKDFGTLLNLVDEVDAWDDKYRGDPDSCWKKVMKHWLDGGSEEDYPPTWEGLYDLLVDVRCSVVAKELKKVVAIVNGLPTSSN